MKITKTDPFTGRENTLDLEITNEQFQNWEDGMLIQDAMPHLCADTREFLISGVLTGTFNKYFDKYETLKIDTPLTNENFFTDAKIQFPEAFEIFAKFIDSYKVAVNWNKFLKEETKFHDIPRELQNGVIELFKTHIFYVYNVLTICENVDEKHNDNNGLYQILQNLEKHLKGEIFNTNDITKPWNYKE